VNKLTLNELIEKLTDLRDDYECGDALVRVAFQPRYPIAATLSEVTLVRGEEGRPETLWLAASDSVPRYGTPEESPYAPSAAWEGGETKVDEEEYDDEEESR
jgi:hypothetical protein